MSRGRHLSIPLDRKRPSNNGKAEQAAAICCCVSDDGLLQILLISSKDTGRWVLPKGYVEKKEPSFRAAQREAFEEAGIIGKVRHKQVGTYAYMKDGKHHLTVAVHLLKFEKEMKELRERDRRRKIWLTPAEAIELVDEPELKTMFASLETHSPLASQEKSLLKKIAMLNAKAMMGTIAPVAIA